MDVLCISRRLIFPIPALRFFVISYSSARHSCSPPALDHVFDGLERPEWNEQGFELRKLEIELD
jgi:hypothetical protein